MKQIKDFIGRRVLVIYKNETRVEGVLVFYHFENQAVHINDYHLTTKNGDIESGKLLIVNQNTWSQITAHGG